jgi:hypothetical protein
VLIRRLAAVALAACGLALWAPAGAQAIGVFDVNGPVLTFNAGAGDIDQIAGFETQSSFRFTRFGGGEIGPGASCTYLGSSNTVDCLKSGVSLIVLNLGDGDDVASISPTLNVRVVFNGQEGNDGLFGGGGIDEFIGGPGNDNIVARDGQAERVDCGDGLDTAITDDPDTRISCEEIEGDADSDGVRRPADCNDTNPAIRPGVIDVPDNGVDEDCSGTDAVNLDRDGDSSLRPQDCDDTNPRIKPGLREVIGNDIDENCDTVIAPFPPLSGSVSSTWTRVGKRTQNLTFVAKGFARGTRITLRCVRSPNCPRGTKRRQVRNSRRSVNLHATLGKRALKTGARLEVRLTRSQRVGRLLSYRFNSPGVPDVSFRCVPPSKPAGLC